MPMSLEGLRTLSAVVREGGVNRAARAIHKVPSAVSQTIQKLERDLGATLFERGGRSMVLTPCGQELVERGALLLEQAEDLATSIRQIANGWETELHIAVSDVVPIEWIFPLIKSLYERSPHTRVSVSREVLAGAWDALVSGRADLVVGASYEAPPGRGIKTAVMGELEFVIAVSPDHPLASVPGPLDDSVYRQYRAAVVPDTSRGIEKMTLGLMTAQPSLVVPDLAAKHAAQLEGIAVGALPRYQVEVDLKSGRLVHIPFAAPFYETLKLAWRRENTGKSLQWMVKAIRDAPAAWLRQVG